MAKTKSVDLVTRNLDRLSDEELKFVARLIQAVLEARENALLKVTEEEKEEEQKSQLSSNGNRFRGYYEEKLINGCGPYRYVRWREGKRLRSKYIGKV